jgi:hypothetical protein
MSDVKELQKLLKNMNDEDKAVGDDFNDFMKATKHGLLTLAASIQDFADLEEGMKDPRRPVKERNALLQTGMDKAVKSFLDASQKVRKFQHRITPVVMGQFKDWESAENAVKAIKIKKAE